MSSEITVTVNGKLVAKVIQCDLSGGQGHCWRSVDADELPAGVREEIAAEIIDGNDECSDYTAGNGQHYRWR